MYVPQPPPMQRGDGGSEPLRLYTQADMDKICEENGKLQERIWNLEEKLVDLKQAIMRLIR